MRFWILAHPKNWQPDSCESRISLKCLHQVTDQEAGPLARNAEATCYRIPCCLPESRVSAPSILLKRGESDIREMEDMELCGTITVAPMDDASLPKAEAAKAKPCVIRPISEVIRSCRRRKLAHLTEETEHVTSHTGKKHKKSKRMKTERLDAD